MEHHILRMLVGTYTEPILFGTGKVLEGKGKGIYAYDIDTGSGVTTNTGIVENVRNPSYLALSPGGGTLFCVNELKSDDKTTGGMVSAYTLTEDPSEALFLGSQPTDGADPCYLTLDRSGRFLLTANFMSGSVSVHPVSDGGELAAMSDFRQHRGSSVDPARQRGPHAHAVTVSADNRYVFVPDLGIDAIVVYELDSERGALRDRDDLAVRVTPGAGPRHLVFSRDNRFAYLINELNSTIAAYRYDPSSGTLSETDVVSTLPADYDGPSTCAHIEVSRCGRFLYGSNRGHDTIAAFRIDDRSGQLASIGHFPTGGGCPRSFAIDPTGRFLAAANQDSDAIVLFSIDPDSGALVNTGITVAVPTPVCIVFADIVLLR